MRQWICFCLQPALKEQTLFTNSVYENMNLDQVFGILMSSHTRSNSNNRFPPETLGFAAYGRARVLCATQSESSSCGCDLAACGVVHTEYIQLVTGRLRLLRCCLCVKLAVKSAKFVSPHMFS